MPNYEESIKKEISEKALLKGINKICESSKYVGFVPEDSNGKCLNVNPVECPKEVAKKVELENILLGILVELKNISEYIDIQKAKELKTINSTHLCTKHGKSQEITFQEVLEASHQCLQE